MTTQQLTGPLLLAAGFVLLLGLERLSPLRQRSRPTPPRLGVNAVLSGLAIATGALAVSPVVLGLAHWTATQRVGLLRQTVLPPVLQWAIGFLLLDLSFYYWHRLNHESRLLWRFHRVHHLDPDLDVTTSFRFHAAEILYSVGFRAAQTILIGPSLAVLTVFQTAFQAATLFHHSNLRLPIGVERTLNLVFVTPRMHGVHHSARQIETNTNYGVVFSLWDRAHRSLRLNVPQSSLTIGVGGHLEPGDNRTGSLLLLPFRRRDDGILRVGSGSAADTPQAEMQRLAE